jgi:hypothetical protein
VYRGNLTPHPDATPDDHKRIKKAFMRTMKRWAARVGCVFQVHATLDIAGPHNAHWDCVAYSTAPAAKLRAAVAAAWRRAGGKRQSLVPLGPDEIKAQCRYQAKDVDQGRRKTAAPLPATHLGLNLVWYTAGFWGAQTVDGLWKARIAEWLANGTIGGLAPSNTKEPTLEPIDTPGTTPESEAFRAEMERRRGALADEAGGSKVGTLVLDDETRAALLAEIDRREAELPQRDKVTVRCVLPTAPEGAVLPERVAAWTELSVDAVQAALDAKPFGVAKVATVKPPQGKLLTAVVFERWFRQVPDDRSEVGTGGGVPLPASGRRGA